MASTDPPPECDPRPRADAQPATGPGDLRRWISRFLLGPVHLVAVLTAPVSLSRCGPDDGPSGGGPQGLSVVVTPASPPCPVFTV